MKHIFLFFYSSIFFLIYTSAHALDIENLDTIKNPHFILSDIHNLGYKIVFSQNIGSRNIYRWESIDTNCTLSIETSTVSRDITDSEEVYLLDNWFTSQKTKNKWKMSYKNSWMKKIFSYTNGIEIVSQGYPGWMCHRKASKLVKQIIPTTQDIIETDISTSVGSVRGNHNSSRYIIGADIKSLFLVDFSWEFTWVVSEDAQYWLPWTILEASLSDGDILDWFSWSGIVTINNQEITYIVLSSMESGKELFSTFYVFPDEEVVGIIILSKIDNPIWNLQSLTSVLDIQSFKKNFQVHPILPTIQEILEAK
jgi:hypothetical protein